MCNNPKAVCFITFNAKTVVSNHSTASYPALEASKQLSPTHPTVVEKFLLFSKTPQNKISCTK